MKKIVTFSTVILANRLCVYNKKCEDWTQKNAYDSLLNAEGVVYLKGSK